MRAEELIAQSAAAIRQTKYYSGGNRDWKGRPVTRIEQRYATAAMTQLLYSLAATGARFDSTNLTRLAHEIEREGGDL